MKPFIYTQCLDYRRWKSRHAIILTKSPAFYPCDETVLNLSKSPTRSPTRKDYYASSIGTDVHPHQYRRPLQIDNDNINDLTTVQFRGMFDAIVLKSNHLRYLPHTLEKVDLESILIISLKSNSLICNCHSKWLKYWLLVARRILNDMEDVLTTFQSKHDICIYIYIYI